MMKTLYSVTAFQFSLCVWFFMKSIVNKLYWVYWVKCILRTYYTIYQKKDLFKKIVSDWLNIDPPWSNLQLNSLILIKLIEDKATAFLFIFLSMGCMTHLVGSFRSFLCVLPRQEIARAVRSAPQREGHVCLWSDPLSLWQWPWARLGTLHGRQILPHWGEFKSIKPLMWDSKWLVSDIGIVSCFLCVFYYME